VTTRVAEQLELNAARGKRSVVLGCGRVLDATKAEYGWLFWYVIMAGFGVLGGISMLLVMRKHKRIVASQAAQS
jgi:hypothetical protein